MLLLLLVDSSSTVAAGVLVVAASLVAMEAGIDVVVDVVNVDGGEGGRFKFLQMGLENNNDDDDVGEGRCVLFASSSSCCCCRSTVLSAVDLFSASINSSSK